MFIKKIAEITHFLLFSNSKLVYTEKFYLTILGIKMFKLLLNFKVFKQKTQMYINQNQYNFKNFEVQYLAEKLMKYF